MDLETFKDDLQPKQLSLFDRVETNIDQAIELALIKYIEDVQSGQIKVSPKDIKILLEIKDYLGRAKKENTNQTKIVYIGEPLL